MISVRAALDHILALSDRLPSEDIALQHAQGRVLAQTVTATRDQPPFAAAAMDGYAVCAADLKAGVKIWQVIGESAAGHAFSKSVASCQATRIFTGAPVPPGTYAVLPQEDVIAEQDQITVSKAVDKNLWVRDRGEDIASGTVIIAAGKRLKPADLALAASVGVTHVAAFEPLKVAILLTGD